MSPVVSRYVNSEIPIASSDLFSAFLANGVTQAKQSGMVAMIVQRVLMYNTDYELLRESILDTCEIHVVGVIGPGGFSEITGEVVDSILVVISANKQIDLANRSAAFIDAVRDKNKASALSKAAKAGRGSNAVHFANATQFQVIKGAPWAFQLSDHTFGMFENARKNGMTLKCRAGISTGDDPRFLRFKFEVTNRTLRWAPIADGGCHERWFRPTIYVVDSQLSFVRERNNLNQNGKARCAIRNVSYQGKQGITYLKNAGDRFAARLHDDGTYFLDTSRSTFPSSTDRLALLGILNAKCISWMLCLIGGGGSFVNTDVERLPFDVTSFRGDNLDSLVEQAVVLAQELSVHESVAFFPFILCDDASGYDASARRLMDLRCAKLAKLQDVEEQIEEAVASRLNIKGDYVEKFPRSERLTEEAVLASFVHTLILQSFGYIWPSRITEVQQIEGVVPQEGIAEEPTIPAVVKDLLVRSYGSTFAGEVVESFGRLLGTSLDTWIRFSFWTLHINVFEKRPVLWHLQTARASSHKAPSWACWVNCQKIDVDTIYKIRTHYTAPLKLRLETEMRGISQTPTIRRTETQSRRMVELEEAIADLHVFDTNLHLIAKSGFGTPELLPTLRQYAFNDAMLSLKSRWLKRLSELLARSPLGDRPEGAQDASPLEKWIDKAIQADLHPELAGWVGDALSRLDYFCSRVGPKAPDAKKTPEDPTAADFTRLIHSDHLDMQIDSMKLACAVWWGKFDAAVLAPIRDRLKMLKAEQKELNAAIKEDRQPVPVLSSSKAVDEEDEQDDAPSMSSAHSSSRSSEAMLFADDQHSEQTTALTKAAMKNRLKDIKAKIKKFNDEINLKAGKAQAIRDAIQAWRLPDPLPPSLDFHPSSPSLPPLFDQISSLNERRSPPETIADFIAQESLYAPDINDGVRVNIAPLQRAGVLAADVLAAKDLDKAIADRAEWRADERRWVREGKLPQCGWWQVENERDA